MQVVLLNISDSDRVVLDRRNRAVKVAVGEMKSADIHEPHYRLMRTGTFLALPEEVQMPERVTRALRLMSVVSTTDYDELLQQFWGLVERDANRLRPTREFMRLALRDMVQNLMAITGVGKPAERRVSVTEEGDENTRDDGDERTEEKQPDNAPSQQPKQTSQPRPTTTRPSNPNRPRQTTRSARA